LLLTSDLFYIWGKNELLLGWFLDFYEVVGREKDDGLEKFVDLFEGGETFQLFEGFERGLLVLVSGDPRML